MSLFAKNQQLLNEEYIKIWDVIELLSSKADPNPNYRWYEVGQYLGHINIDDTFDLYHLNKYNQLNLLEKDEQSKILFGFIEELMSTLFEDEEDKKKIISKAKWSVMTYYWKKSQIFSSEYFKEFNLFGNYSSNQKNIEYINYFDDETYLNIILQDNWKDREIDYDEITKIDNLLNTHESLEPYSDSRLKRLHEDLLIKDTSLDLLDADLKLARQEIRKLKIEIIEQAVLLEQDLTGLSRFNQLNKDRAGMAKIIALYFWGEPEHKDTDPIKMAEIVRREMKNYCNDRDLPKTDEALKRIISCVAPENVRRQGRRHKK
ncbi:hypothetical protein Q5M51_11880 [Acinetobacter baumannii]|nr:hypothetical protein [Acinetobacter baumannii]